MGTSGDPQKAAAAKKAAKRRPTTMDHLRGKKKIERKVYVHLDPAISEAFDEVNERLEAMRADHRDRRLNAAQRGLLNEDFDRMLDDEMSVMEREWDEASEALDKTTAIVLMRSPGRKKYEALLNEHPATEEQNAEHQKEHNADAPYNAETFGPALISLCAAEPEMTPEEAQELVDEWNLNEAMLLFVGALEVCQMTQVSHLGKGSGRTSASMKS